VQDEVAARNRLSPTRVIFQIGSKKSQAIARVGAANFQHGAHVALAFQASNGRADLMACSQKLHDAIAADKTRAAGYQNCL
jgi:hypothetical protein